MVPTEVRNGSASVIEALAHQRDAQVVLRVGEPVGLIPAALPAVEQRDGFIEALLAHEDVAEQVHALGFEIRREPALHFLDGALGAIQITARVPDLAEVEPGAVAHAFGHRLRQQCLEAFTGLVVQTQRQIEPAEQQVGLRIVVRHAAPLPVGLQARDRLEVLALVVIEECVAEMQVAHHGRRQLVDLRFRGHCRRNEAGRERHARDG